MRKKLFKKQMILEAIKGSGGYISTIAKKLNCDWHVAKRNVERFPEALQAISDEEETLLDFAEKSAFQKIKEGDTGMIKFVLATKGRARGYGENVQVKADVDTDIHIINDFEL